MEFKIRCSAISNIMAEPKNKTELISVGAQTYCKQWLKQQLFGRSPLLTTKYIKKGLDTEENGLNLTVKVLKLGMIYKNEERKNNKWMTGEIDFQDKGIIYDNKASYSLDTFPMFEDKLDPKYYAQMQGYLDLWNLETAKVCFTLVDTPIDILEKELKWIEDVEEKQQKALNHVFTEKYWKEVKTKFFNTASDIKFISIEDVKRFKGYEVKRDNDFINKIHIKTELCQQYINQLLKKI